MEVITVWPMQEIKKTGMLNSAVTGILMLMKLSWGCSCLSLGWPLSHLSR